MEENPTEEKIDGEGKKWLVEECRKRGFTAPPYQIHVHGPSGSNVSVVITKVALEDPQNAVTGVGRYKELLGTGLPKTKRMEEDQLKALLKLVLQDPRFAEGSPVVSPAFFNRSAQDLFCVVLFWAYWVGMCILAAVAYSTGDPLRLVRPTDYQGNACDDTTLETTNGRPNLVYPRIAEDAASMMQTQDAACASSEEGCFYGICVAECPLPGDIVCNYEAEGEINTLPVADRQAAKEQRATYRQGVSAQATRRCASD